MHATPEPPVETGHSWHALSAREVLSLVASDESGLTDVEAKRRLALHGPNTLLRAPAESAWRIIVRQFRSVVIGLLVAAGAIAWWMGDPLDSAAIATVLVLNVSIGFVTEFRARRAMEALLKLDVSSAVVVRDGSVRDIDARDLVPGDVVAVEPGQAVPADARLLTATDLQTNESALTGESTTVIKDAIASLPEGASLPDRTTMIYKGTTVADGVARAVVVATGMATEVGNIGVLVRGIHDESTPLEQRMDSLGRQLAVLAVAIGGIVALLDLVRGEALGVVLEMGIAVAIAAVPEGLPAVVTTTMAIAMRRMAHRHALARRLTAVEALGSVTVICTDKTGTLTAGTQAVTAVWLPEIELDLTIDSPLDSADQQRLNDALEIGTLANRASILRVDDHWEGRGDPSELALLFAARKYGIVRAELVATKPEAGEVPFSSARMLMATIHRADGKQLMAYVKGAPGRILERCARVRTATAHVPMDQRWRQRIEGQAAAMATRGLRVMALADGRVSRPTEGALRDLNFVALVGIRDPAAPDVARTIAILRDAGIRTVMLTGDHRATALAVARELGVVSDADEAIDGSALDGMTDDVLATRIDHIGIVSRVSPEGKLRVIAAQQRRGEVVAMIGDGINDAAALKKANIGVAMGGRGTDAAKEVAGIVLGDDRFPTIAAAVEEGRVVVANIRKFIFYLFSCNVAEIISLLAAGIGGLPLPMTPLQVLWMNLVTDTFPALALAIEPPEEGVMRQRPRDPKAPLLSRRVLWRGIGYSVLIAGVTLAALIAGLRLWPGQVSRAVTLSFTTLALAQIFHLGNARGHGPVVTASRIVSNPYALGAVALTLALQVLAVAWRPLGSVLGTSPLGVQGWLFAFALSAIPAVVGQAWRLVRG